MTKLLLVVIAVMWIVVLVPPLLRSRSEGRPGDSIVSFRRQLTTLQRSAPFTSAAPGRRITPSGEVRVAGAAVAVRPARVPERVDTRAALRRLEARRRRQTILIALVGACVVTAVLAGSLYSARWWYVNFALDAVLALYVYALVQMRRARETQALRQSVESWSRAA